MVFKVLGRVKLFKKESTKNAAGQHFEASKWDWEGLAWWDKRKAQIYDSITEIGEIKYTFKAEGDGNDNSHMLLKMSCKMKV